MKVEGKVRTIVGPIEKSAWFQLCNIFKLMPQFVIFLCYRQNSQFLYLWKNFQIKLPKSGNKLEKN